MVVQSPPPPPPPQKSTLPTLYKFFQRGFAEEFGRSFKADDEKK
jgi:hypothetical protein